MSGYFKVGPNVAPHSGGMGMEIPDTSEIVQVRTRSGRQVIAADGLRWIGLARGGWYSREAGCGSDEPHVVVRHTRPGTKMCTEYIPMSEVEALFWTGEH